MELTTAQRDRAAGVLLATAAGDALGAGYEFGPPLPDDRPVGMIGGGAFGWEPGEWTDDTSMALVIADAVADGADPREPATQGRIAAGWYTWSRQSKDVGAQTGAVLGSAHRSARAAGRDCVTAADLREAARGHHESTGRSGGNGSLMRTAPLALAYLDDGEEAHLADAARQLSALTHVDPEAGEACALWCLAIRHAVRTGELDLRRSVQTLPPDRREVWTARLDQAESSVPSDFSHNGWVVQALQAAWCAISRAPAPVDDPTAGTFRAQRLPRALEAAVRGGRDTDTVAAIAGGLLGALHGASAVPAGWRRMVHGWPGRRAGDLVRLGLRIAGHGQRDRSDTPSMAETYRGYGDSTMLVRDPHDDGLWLGGFGALTRLPETVDAVVSLCQVGVDDVPEWIPPENRVQVWLVDASDRDENPNLEFVLDDAARAVRDLRSEGRTVLLHCVQAMTRTPTVAALYGARHAGIPVRQALDEVRRALPRAKPNDTFVTALAAFEAP